MTNGRVQHDSSAERVLHFPADRALGHIVRVMDEEAYRYGRELGEEVGPARGTLIVPGTGHLYLRVEGLHTDLSPLAALAPDTFHKIIIPPGYAEDDQLLNLRGLTGLRALSTPPHR